MTFEKHPEHDHYFIEDGILIESYHTNRGLRTIDLLELPGYPDTDHCSIELLNSLKALPK